MTFSNDNFFQFGRGVNLGGTAEHLPFEFSIEYKKLLQELVETDLRAWNERKKIEFWRKELGQFIKIEKLSPQNIKERVGLVTELSPEPVLTDEVKLSRRALAIKKIHESLNPQGLALTVEAQQECLKIYNSAFNYFIESISKIDVIEGNSVKIIPRGMVGSFAERNARLGIHPLGVTFLEAKNENFALKRKEQRGIEFPSDLDFKVVYEISHGKVELSQGIDKRLGELVEKVFTEYGVFIQVDRYDVRNAVPMEEIEKNGGLYGFYMRRNKASTNHEF